MGFLGFDAVTLFKEENLSHNPVDILSFEKVCFECNIPQGKIFRDKRGGIVQNFTEDVNPGDKHNENFRSGVQWYMMQSKNFVSSISFKLKNENGGLVSFSGQSSTFCLSIKEIYFFLNDKDFIKITIIPQ